MKNLVMKISTRVMTVMMLISLPLIATSCEKDDLNPMNSNPSAMIDADNMRSDDSFSTIGEGSIASIAIDAGFDQLVGALVYVDQELNAGLVDLFLNGTDQFTVFAPSNEAFMSLYSALGISNITDLDAALVLDVLLYHVVAGRNFAANVVSENRTNEITTLLGKTFKVDSSAQITDIAGNTIGIVSADIPASNGVIHVINGVLLPLD